MMQGVRSHGDIRVSEPLIGPAVPDPGVRAQALTGARNRRVAATLARVWADGQAVTDVPPGLVGEYLCTCGRPDCDEILVLTLEEYRFVLEREHRFVVAPGHATDFDDVVLRADEYDVVEVVEPYRHLIGDPAPLESRDRFA